MQRKGTPDMVDALLNDLDACSAALDVGFELDDEAARVVLETVAALQRHVGDAIALLAPRAA